jgi:hypothetical protein
MAMYIWDVMLCSMVHRYQHLSASIFRVTPEGEAANSSKTLVPVYCTKWFYISEVGNHNAFVLSSCVLFFYFSAAYFAEN